MDNNSIKSAESPIHDTCSGLPVPTPFVDRVELSIHSGCETDSVTPSIRDTLIPNSDTVVSGASAFQAAKSSSAVEIDSLSLADSAPDDRQEDDSDFGTGFTDGEMQEQQPTASLLSTKKRLAQLLPGWAISMIAHTLLLVILAVWSQQTVFQSPLSIVATADDDGGAEMLNLDTAFMEMSSSSSAAESAEAMEEIVEELKLETLLAPAELLETADPLELATGSALWGETTGVDRAGELNGLNVGVSGLDQLDGEGANFFGVSAGGKSFIYIIDCSGSMGGARWLTAREELVRSLSRLQPDQSFCILLYSSVSWSKEGDVSAAVFEKATEKSVREVAMWLNRQVPGGGTEAMPAVKQALSLMPDAIFLLSDGELRDDTRGYLWRNNGRKLLNKNSKEKPVAVHTISVGQSVGAELMKVIAAENAGQFQLIY